jgi:hypothetical protein
MLVYGTAIGSQQICFTRAYSRANLPWASKLHLLAHIIMAEAPLRQRDKVSSTFYLRRAQAYEAMNDHLSDENASFREKVVSFLTLSLIETSLGMLDLQAKHVDALHNFIQNNGGMSRILSELCPANLADDLPGILIQHLSENVPIVDVSVLEDTIDQFIQVLRNTREWASNITAAAVAMARQLQPGQDAFPRLRNYLDSLVDHLNRDDLSPRVPQGIFHCIFGNLMLHQVGYNWDAPTSLRFLAGIEDCLTANTKSITCEVLFSNIFWVKGAASTSLMNSVHSKISKPVKAKEITVLEGTYASLRSVALLSPPVRAKVAQSIHACVLATIRPLQADLMKEDFLTVVAEDIRKNWSAIRMMNRSDSRYLNIKKLTTYTGLREESDGP